MRFWWGWVLIGVLGVGMAAGQNPTGIDFSYAGYGGGGVALPRVKAVVAVRPSGGDDTVRLQAALDQVAARAVGADGFRGAVLLGAGRFRVGGQLRMSASGVVLRGSVGTVVVAEGMGRRTLIEVGGGAGPELGPAMEVLDERVAAGARSLRVSGAAGLAVGTHVVVRRPSTAEWIKAHGMSGLLGTFADQRVDWKPGSHDLVWDRVVTAVDGDSVQLDAPLTFEMTKAMGGGTVSRVTGREAIRKVGVEHLRLESAVYAGNPKDEEHAWIAVALDHVEDAWARDVTARHFVSSAVRAGAWARKVTIEDVRSEAPVAEEGGYRRQGFAVYGQQVLVFRCASEAGMNDFATGLLAAGPNVFLEDSATASLEPSGAFKGLTAGVLYERVKVPEARIELLLDQTRAQGAGWTAVNSLIWNSEAKSLDALGPYDGYNYVVQGKGPLYEAELAARGLRLDRKVVAWGAEAAEEFRGALPVAVKPVGPRAFSIVGGRFVVEGKVLYGGTQGEAWWHGNTSPAVAGALSGSSISRWMPGQTGPGLTENLAELAARVKRNGNAIYQTIPGLWYDHRRDEHTVTRQPNGDVWAPFFEMPWARSGKGMAWDGLSRFDVAKYNPWYFARQKEFARIAGQLGLIEIHNMYNTHDVLEIGPHWIDYPWRPANNVNDTGLPEPPPFSGGYTVSMDTVQPTVTKLNVGNEFYSVAYAPLLKLHHDYITHVLDELGDEPDVIFTIGYQYAGPQAFAEFWLDTVAEWEARHRHRVKVALATSKGITDAILAQPERRQDVALVDMRYWYYLADGTLFAPEAGQNRAFRDMIATQFGGNYSNGGPPTTEEQVYRQVREYRDRWPEIALTALENGGGAWPIVMAGGAMPSSRGGREDAAVERVVRERLAGDLMRMSPVDGWVAGGARNWVLAAKDAAVVMVYSLGGEKVVWAKELGRGEFAGEWVDPATGEGRGMVKVDGGAGASLVKPDGGRWVLVLRASL